MTRRLLSRLAKKDVMSITENSAQRIKELLSTHPESKGVRLSIRKRGCNGHSYNMNYVNEVNPQDEIVEQHGVKLFVDPKSTLFLVGTKMDYVKSALGSEFVFQNPNSTAACGCGESFHVKGSEPKPR